MLKTHFKIGERVRHKFKISKSGDKSALGTILYINNQSVIMDMGIGPRGMRRIEC